MTVLIITCYFYSCLYSYLVSWALGPFTEQLCSQGWYLIYSLCRYGRHPSWRFNPPFHFLIGRGQDGRLGDGGNLVDVLLAHWRLCGVTPGRRRQQDSLRGGEELEAVSRGQALPAMEGAFPPALTANDILLQNCQDVSFAEGQLIGALCFVVIQCLRQGILEREEET